MDPTGLSRLRFREYDTWSVESRERKTGPNYWDWTGETYSLFLSSAVQWRGMLAGHLVGEVRTSAGLVWQGTGVQFVGSTGASKTNRRDLIDAVSWGLDITYRYKRLHRKAWTETYIRHNHIQIYETDSETPPIVNYRDWRGGVTSGELSNGCWEHKFVFKDPLLKVIKGEAEPELVKGSKWKVYKGGAYVATYSTFKAATAGVQQACIGVVKERLEELEKTLGDYRFQESTDVAEQLDSDIGQPPLPGGGGPSRREQQIERFNNVMRDLRSAPFRNLMILGTEGGFLD
jgi:hypothetical protein